MHARCAHRDFVHRVTCLDPSDVSTTAQCPLKSKDRVSLLSFLHMAHLVSDIEPSLVDQHAILLTEPVCHGQFSAVLVCHGQFSTALVSYLALCQKLIWRDPIRYILYVPWTAHCESISRTFSPWMDPQNPVSSTVYSATPMGEVVKWCWSTLDCLTRDCSAYIVTRSFFAASNASVHSLCPGPLLSSLEQV